MIVPNKLIKYKESIIYKMLELIKYEERKKIDILDLYYNCKKCYSCIDEFIYSLEVLYILDYIEIDFNRGEVIYVKRNRKQYI